MRNARVGYDGPMKDKAQEEETAIWDSPCRLRLYIAISRSAGPRYKSKAGAALKHTFRLPAFTSARGIRFKF